MNNTNEYSGYNMNPNNQLQNSIHVQNENTPDGPIYQWNEPYIYESNLLPLITRKVLENPTVELRETGKN
ncbi:unnamed protein product [Brachionus calyciflorus]|uniref:Uncharacterized protein n=1 Tax=Brachionus calyciflorus TaxID=104777 RepID=A0A814N2I2_9BILA|nr:unnamed protein product [Brachionus calyciflorus]